MSIRGNKKAGETVKKAVERAGTRRRPERFALLAFVKHTISESMWKETKQRLRIENDRRLPLQRARYDMALENQAPDVAALERAAQVSK